MECFSGKGWLYLLGLIVCRQHRSLQYEQVQHDRMIRSIFVLPI